MSDVLVIAGPEERDPELVAEVARRPADRVTVLIETPAGARRRLPGTPTAGRPASEPGRIAELLRRLESVAGAEIVGLAEDRSQLRGWRFDRIVRAGTPPHFSHLP